MINRLDHRRSEVSLENTRRATIQVSKLQFELGQLPGHDGVFIGEVEVGRDAQRQPFIELPVFVGVEEIQLENIGRRRRQVGFDRKNAGQMRSSERQIRPRRSAQCKLAELIYGGVRGAVTIALRPLCKDLLMRCSDNASIGDIDSFLREFVEVSWMPVIQ